MCQKQFAAHFGGNRCQNRFGLNLFGMSVVCNLCIFVIKKNKPLEFFLKGNVEVLQRKLKSLCNKAGERKDVANKAPRHNHLGRGLKSPTTHLCKAPKSGCRRESRKLPYKLLWRGAKLIGGKHWNAVLQSIDENFQWTLVRADGVPISECLLHPKKKFRRHKGFKGIWERVCLRHLCATGDNHFWKQTFFESTLGIVDNVWNHPNPTPDFCVRFVSLAASGLPNVAVSQSSISSLKSPPTRSLGSWYLLPQIYPPPERPGFGDRIYKSLFF